VAGVGDFILPELWEALVDPEHKPLERNSPYPVYVGLDLAVKPGGDDAAVVGLYADGAKIRVAFHKVWRGGRHRTEDLRISETVKPALLEAAKRCSVGMVGADPWQSYQLLEDLRRAGLPVMEIPQTHASRGPSDTALYELARNGDLVLYPDDDLVGAAGYASAKELGNGLLFITKAGRGKIDLLIAMSNALAGMMAPVTTYTIMELPRVPIDTRY